METPILLTLLILGITVVLFIIDIFSVDKTAFFILISTMLCGLVTPEEAVSGFSNPAVITILCLMVLAKALEENGVIAGIANRFSTLSQLSLWLVIPLIMFFVGLFSSFISTTAVVIVFIKLVNDLAKKNRIDRNKLLLPISFAGILGGTSTLMGTSTNLIVNNITKTYGQETFQFFEFTHIGVILFFIATPVIVILSMYCLPKQPEKDTELENQDNYIASISINEGSPLVGKPIKETFFHTNPQIHVFKIERGRRIYNSPQRSLILEEGDKVILKADFESLINSSKKEGISILKKNGSESYYSSLHELLILPNSPYIGYDLEELEKNLATEMTPLAIQKNKDFFTGIRVGKSLFSKIKVEVGDRILIGGSRKAKKLLEQRTKSHLLRSVNAYNEIPRYKKAVSFISIITVVLLAGCGFLTIMQSALIGLAMCVFTRTISFKKAYEGINWQVIFLLAGMIPLGIGMKNTGTDMYIAEILRELLAGKSPGIVLSVFFLFTMILSGFVSNNATAIVIVPIAISLSSMLEMNAKPFILAIMFAASFSFFTPIGYQTNAIIYGIGVYKFKHFLLIGGILSIILWISASFIIPYFYF